MKKMIASLFLLVAAACGMPYGQEEQELYGTSEQALLSDRQIQLCRSLINRALQARDVEAARHFYARCMEIAADDRSRDQIRDLDPDRRDLTRLTRDDGRCRDARCPVEFR